MSVTRMRTSSQKRCNHTNEKEEVSSQNAREQQSEASVCPVIVVAEPGGIPVQLDRLEQLTQAIDFDVADIKLGVEAVKIDLEDLVITSLELLELRTAVQAMQTLVQEILNSDLRQVYVANFEKRPNPALVARTWEIKDGSWIADVCYSAFGSRTSKALLTMQEKGADGTTGALLQDTIEGGDGRCMTVGGKANGRITVGASNVPDVEKPVVYVQVTIRAAKVAVVNLVQEVTAIYISSSSIKRAE
eukprot:scaffold2651_cov171-Amphora_coffeaeformis.AAC.2